MVKQKNAIKTQNPPLGRLLINAFRAFEAALLTELQLQGFKDISLSHLNVIRHLNPKGMKLVELSKDAALSKQAISKIVNNLEEKGYIKVAKNQDDGRAKIVRFTKKGHALVEAATSIVRISDDEYMKKLGEEQYILLKDSLNMIIEAKQ